MIPFFAFAQEIGRLIHTTNAIESLHSQLRKIIKTREHFPSDEAASKLIWLALRNITTDQHRSVRPWSLAMNQLAIMYPDRVGRTSMRGSRPTCERGLMNDSISFGTFMRRLNSTPHQKRRWLVTDTPGVALAYEIHRSEKPLQDLLIFYHGGGAHGRAGYDRMAQALVAAAPVGVCLPDMRGHGASGGPRGHAFPPSLIWDDVDRMVAAMRHAFPDARIHLGGHSSGAGMLLNHLTRRPPREAVQSLIMLAPELGWRAGLYRNSSHFGSFAQIRIWPFVLAALTGGMLGSRLPAVSFNFPEEAESIGCLRTYSVGMANAVTPNKPATQIRQLMLPTHLAIANEDQIIDSERLEAFIKHNAGPHLMLSRLPRVDHLGIILDAIPFLCQALGHSPAHEKQTS